MSARVAAAAAAAADISAELRAPAKSAVCACQLLGGLLEAPVEFDQAFGRDIADDSDRSLVRTIAATTQALLLGFADALDVRCETSPETITVVTQFPQKTCFDVEQFITLKTIDEDRIRSVWVQPEATSALICVSVWRSSVVRPSTVLDVVLVRRRVDVARDNNPTDKKRRRGGAS